MRRLLAIRLSVGRLRLAAVTFVAVFGGGLSLWASSAAACSTSDHCYALMENFTTFEGTNASILISSDAIPGWNAGDRQQDEEWAQFPDNGWVESGATTGTTYGGDFPNPIYFYAQDEPVSSGYTETDITYDGPGTGNWFTTGEEDLGNGVWCPFIDGGQLPCAGGLPLYSTYQTAGLEVAANTPPLNTGTIYAAGVALGTGAQQGYPDPLNDPDVYDAYVDTNGANDGYCVIPIAPLDGAPGMAFGTPNDNPQCLNNQGIGYVALTGSPTSISGDGLPAGPTPPVNLPHAGQPTSSAYPTPASNYQSTSAPALDSSQVSAIAQSVAKQAGDSSSDTEADVQADVQSATTVSASLSDAMKAINPSVKAPTNATAGMAGWLNSSTDVVVMHGNFKLTDSAVPPGAPTPTGNTLELVIDAHTGSVDEIHLGNEATSGLASLGTLQRLEVSIPSDDAATPRSVAAPSCAPLPDARP